MNRGHFTVRTFGFYLTQLCLLVWLATAPPLSAFGAVEDPPAPVVAPGSFPGLQEVVPQASQLAVDVAQMATGVTNNVDVDALNRQSEQILRSWQAFSEQVQGYGELNTWPVNRLLQAQTQVEQQALAFGNMLALVTEPLSAFEDIRTIWTARKQYWNDWQTSLTVAGAAAPRQTFRKVDETIARMLRDTGQTVTALVQLQQRISKEQDALLQLREQLNAELANLRHDPFKRNGHPLLTLDFFQQFDQALFAKALEGIRATFQFSGDFYKRQWQLIVIQAALALLLFWLFRYLERVTEDRTDEWEFVFQRPVAAALFIAATLPQLFYVAPPPLLLLTMTTLAAFSAARLATELISSRSERRYIYLIASAYTLFGALNVAGIPLPFQRLFLTIFCLGGIPDLLLSARRKLRRRQRVDKVISALTLGALILLAGLVAELTGYVTFASHLLEAAFGTILLLLLATMMLRIGEGGIDFFFTIESISNRQFVRQLGLEAPRRLKTLLRIVIIISTVNYLLEVWGLVRRFGNIWQSLLTLEFSVGDFHLSLKMVLLVTLVLYVAILTSWIIQAFLESQLMHNKNVDRGVRDAIKKLGHYALMLIGFLVAMSMAGIDLKNFTILAGAFGIGIGFGLQDIVNNFVSGLILLFERPVKVGDTVIVGDNWGTIKNIGMRSTVVETLDLSEIIVPNSQLISEKVTNWTLSSKVSRLVLPVGVKYGTDMKKVLAILEKVAHAQPEVVKTPPPSAIFTEFGDSSLNFELRVWIEDIMARFKVRSALGIGISDEFHAAGIEIPFPQRDLHLRSVEAGIMEGVRPPDPTTKKPAPRKKAAPVPDSEND